MTIYTSEKVMPYVYKGTHRVTGEFYIGSRTTPKQKLPSHEDIYQYRTSSKMVKPIFDEFDWVIVAEFFDPISAFLLEQQLIAENWDNPLKLNRACYNDYNKLFCMTGNVMSKESRIKISAARTGTVLSAETKQKMSDYAKTKRPPMSAETCAKKSTARSGKPRSAETKAKITAALLNRPKEIYAKRSEAMKGHKHSDETKAKLRAARARREAARKDNQR